MVRRLRDTAHAKYPGRPQVRKGRLLRDTSRTFELWRSVHRTPVAQGAVDDGISMWGVGMLREQAWSQCVRLRPCDIWLARNTTSKSRLTVKLRGRATTPDERRGRTISSGARGAGPPRVHGPL